MNRVGSLAIMAVALAAASCATGAVRQRSTLGKLTVGVTASGSARIPDTFRVTVTPAGLSGDVKSDAGVFISDVVPMGEQVVRLTLPANCRADNGAERTVTFSAQRRTAVLRFEVRCS
jgi:hypothetical protein